MWENFKSGFSSKEAQKVMDEANAPIETPPQPQVQQPTVQQPQVAQPAPEVQQPAAPQVAQPQVAQPAPEVQQPVAPQVTQSTPEVQQQPTAEVHPGDTQQPTNNA